ncbi:MAG: SDR family oxidoreductase [Clostridia bacterium]|nr:SDR family oxidoreductase [Clostridia bacterium]
MKNMNTKIALVTGGSSGIGRCTAISLKNMGCKVYEISRRDIPCEGITHLTADVTDENAVKSAVKSIIEADDRIDILINCAGFGISGAVEFTEEAEARKQFDVNFFGTVNVTKAVLPFMRKNKVGRIVNVSSVAAVAHIPFQTYYSASKAAIESYTCCLANEVKPFGITVTAVQPGDIATEFTAAREKSFEGDDAYCGRIGRSVAGMERDEEKGMRPEKAGEYIAKIALKKKVKPVYAIGFTYKFLAVLCKIFPSSVRNYIVGMLYAK